MQIESLKYLLELARYQSLNEAAARMFISPQGLGKAITQLERQLGVKLIERDSKGVVFTPQGKRCLEFAAKISDNYDCMITEIASGSPENGNERVAWLTSSYVTQVMIFLSGASAGYENFNAEEVGFENGLTLLEETAEPLVFTADVLPETLTALKGRGLSFEPLAKVSLGIIWQEGIGNSLKPNLRPAEVAELPLVVFSERSINTLLNRVFADAPLKDVRSRFGNPLSVISAIRQQGIYALTDSMVFNLCRREQGMEELRFSSIVSNDAIFHVGYIYRTELKPEGRCRALMNAGKVSYTEFTWID